MGIHGDLNSGASVKILEYLQHKYRVDTPTTMTKVEAGILGIPYPLRSGWLKKHGSREIPNWALVDLRAALTKRLKKQEQHSSKGAAITRRGVAAALPKPAAPPASDAFLESYEWRRIRMHVLKLQGARCQCCGSTPADGVKMHVDHIKPRKLYPSLALDINNLQVLCEVCNHGKGNWDMTDWRGNAEDSGTRSRATAKNDL
jgi:hypothetical protein